MYKKIFIPISIVGTILFTGCGADTSPIGAIEKVINDKQINSQKDVIELIESFYKRTSLSIENPKCGNLETNSKNIIDLSIIELANKFCKNSSGLKTEMKKTLSTVNTDKSMDIKLSQIDGSQAYIDAGYPKDQVHILIDRQISLEEINKIFAYMKRLKVYYNNTNSDKKILKMCKYLSTKDEFKKWMNTSVQFLSFDDFLEAFEEGLTTPEKYKKWISLIGSYKKIALYKKAGVKDSEEAFLWGKARIYNLEYIKSWKSHGFDDPKKLLKWVELGYTASSYKEFEKFSKIGIKDIEDFKPWAEAHCVSPYVIEKYQEIKLTPNDIKKYNLTNVSVSTVQSFLAKGCSIEDIYEIQKITNKYSNFKNYLSKFNISKEDAIHDLKNSDITPIKKAFLWKKIGVNSKAEVNSWQKGGYYSPEYNNIKKIKRFGFKNYAHLKKFSKKYNFNMKHLSNIIASLDYKYIENSSIDDLGQWLKLLNEKDKKGKDIYYTLMITLALNAKDFQVMIDKNAFSGKNINHKEIKQIKRWYKKIKRTKDQSNIEYLISRKNSFIKKIKAGAKNYSDLNK